jgi:hypothetical protein
MARGIGEVVVSSVRASGTRRPVVRLAPVVLPASAQVRLRRVAPGATYREELGQLLVPVPEGQSAATAVLGILEELIPLPDSGATPPPGKVPGA